MLKTRLLHPEILETLARSGHGSKVLIADGNFPFASGAPAQARQVYLNLMPGIAKATDVLQAIADIIPIESAEVMMPEDGSRPAIFDDFEKLLPNGMRVQGRARADFYAGVRSPQTTLVIATAEQRIFGNILLTIGVVPG